MVVQIIKDRLTENLTRFGFVEMPDQIQAWDAIRRIKEINGAQVLVKKSNPNADYSSQLGIEKGFAPIMFSGE
jgi:hypothetical protein